MDEKQSSAESEIGRAGHLVGEVVDARAQGNFEPTSGNSDDDLLGAVEELEGAIRDWRRALEDARPLLTARPPGSPPRPWPPEVL